MIFFPNQYVNFHVITEERRTEFISEMKDKCLYTFKDGIFTTEFDYYCYFHLSFDGLITIHAIHLAAMYWFFPEVEGFGYELIEAMLLFCKKYFS